MEGQMYPDVYCIPYYFADRFDFIRNGERPPPNRYDLLISELPGYPDQLEYLESLVLDKSPPVAVIPGPPEILSRDMTPRKLSLIKSIFVGARYVWAYSESVRNHYDALIGMRKAEVIPWPFHLEKTLKLGRLGGAAPKDHLKVLFQVPLRFSGVTRNHPFMLRRVLAAVLDALPPSARSRLALHTFIYAEEDRREYRASDFGAGLPLHLESKKSYASFIRFIGGCDAVVNLTVGNILGRITFLSGALGKPGIFSDNADINRDIYPHSCVPLEDEERVRDLLGKLLSGLLEGRVDGRFLPSLKELESIGNYPANAEKMRRLFMKDDLCAAS